MCVLILHGDKDGAPDQAGDPHSIVDGLRVAGSRWVTLKPARLPQWQPQRRAKTRLNLHGRSRNLSRD